MEVLFTSHAEARIVKRKIAYEEVIDAIKYPEKVMKRYGKYCFQKNIGRGIIEVVCERRGKHIKVVTVYWV